MVTPQYTGLITVTGALGNRSSTASNAVFNDFNTCTGIRTVTSAALPATPTTQCATIGSPFPSQLKLPANGAVGTYQLTGLFINSTNVKTITTGPFPLSLCGSSCQYGALVCAVRVTPPVAVHCSLRCRVLTSPA